MGAAGPRARRDAGAVHRLARRTSTWRPAADQPRIIDIRKIDGPFTPKDQFFTTQHYGHPEVDPATFRLKVSGLVNRPLSLSLDELRQMGEHGAGRRASSARATAVRCRALSATDAGPACRCARVLDQAGVKPEAREFVFFGADHGEEEVEFRTQKFTVDQQFGRSLPREKALVAEPFLAYALNGEPLTPHQGFPLRLLVPGWYGVANVKWLSQIHVQEDAYLGKFQARLVPHAEGRDDRRRDEVDGDRDHAHAAEVVHRARHAATATGTRCSASC